MSIRISSRSIIWLITFLFLFALSGCGGGNGPETGTEDEMVSDSDTDTGPVGDNGSGGPVDDGGSGDPVEALGVVASIDGDPVPGQLAQLRASIGAGDSPVAFSWEQTSGPPVLIEGANSGTAQFRVPPLGRDTLFAFRVTVTNSGGETARYRVRVPVAALNWSSMKVLERRVGNEFVVFRADREINNQIDLYRAELDGSDIIKLNGPLAPGGNVKTFSIAPDGRHVAYLADEDNVGTDELYLADADDGDSIRISGVLAPGGNVTPGFMWAPNSTRIAYRADQNTDEVFELFAGFPGGGSNRKLSGTMTDGGDVVEANFYWSANSRHIAYRADQFTDETLELFVSFRDGTRNVRVSTPVAPDGGVLGSFAWSPTSGDIAYLADQLSTDTHELFVVERDGSNNTKVSGPLVGDGTVLDFDWAPDGSALAYRAEQISSGLIELFRVLPDGSDNAFVSALPPFGDVGSFDWSPDSQSIGYLADQEIDGRVELFVSGPPGSVNRRVSGPMVAGGEVREFAWSPDSWHLAYRADQTTTGVFELFTSSAGGVGHHRVSGPLVAGGNVMRDWQWSGDSMWLAYRADQRVAGKNELFTARPDASANILVSSAVIPSGDVEAPEGDAFQWTGDSSRIVYAADQDEDDKYELYVAAPDGGIANTGLSGELTTGGDVVSFSLTSRPGQQRPRKILLYAADPADRLDDVAAKLRGTGLFDSVDVLSAVTSVPTLATLQEYHAVLTWSDSHYINPVAIGNVLADYVDSGGGVVVGIFSFDLGTARLLQGRFQNDNYFAIAPGARTFGPTVALGDFIEDHPIMNGIGDFNGGTGSYRLATSTIAPDAVSVARWADNSPLVVTREIGGVRRVDLGFYPVSSDAGYVEFWDASTDGDLIMANALLYVMGEI